MASIAADGTVLDTWFPAPELAGDGPSGTVRLSVAEVPAELAQLAARDEDRDVDVVVVRTMIASLDDKPADTYDAYGPLGAKSAGETPIIPVAPALGNALVDATGIRFDSLPFSADRIFARLAEVK